MKVLQKTLIRATISIIIVSVLHFNENNKSQLITGFSKISIYY
ncbi:hypothetical protein SAMN04487764_2437 [Gillisia sp. Hel1_33_143]|nr:hypothetical protein SAMN04487764_2437 [Gillisia sp. Hel1_33_143]